jgi:class 3 adenylate cyclase
MVQYIPLKDSGSEGIKEILKELKTVPGTCFFIDLHRSTAIKYHAPASEWITRFHNTFSFISFLNDFPDNIVKGIGDEIMLFIPDEELRKKSAYDTHFALLEEIHATIYNILHFPVQEKFLNCKVAIHHCSEAYNISFFRGANDFYGKEIDLTARLMLKTTENRIVMSESFYRKVKEDLLRAGLPENAGCLGTVSGTFSEQFKGIPFPVEYRYIDVE